MVKKLIPIFLLCMLLIPLAEAHFPATHGYLIKEACEAGYDSELARMCCRDINACISGTVLVDVSVIYYLERGLMKYSVTHSPLFCEQAIAKARTPTEEALAAGICLHHVTDAVSHNFLVPESIRMTGLSNLMVHAFAEQKVDDYVKTIRPDSEAIMQEALSDAMSYTPFMVSLLQPNPNYQDVDVESLMVGFLQQVRNSSTGYDVGFGAYGFETLQALPNTIFFYLFMVMAVCIVGIYLIFTKTQLKLINIFTIALLGFVLLIILLAIVSTAFGKLWEVSTTVISPIASITPTPSERVVIQQSELHVKNMFAQGIRYLRTGLPEHMRDPSGIGTAQNPGPIRIAERETRWIRGLYWLILIGLLTLLGYLNYRTRE